MLSFNISYSDLIKFPYFVHTNWKRRGLRVEKKETQRQGEDKGTWGRKGIKLGKIMNEVKVNDKHLPIHTS
jgi:hypothetical protein